MIDFSQVQSIPPAQILKAIALIMGLSVAVSYIIHLFTGGKWIIPGDLYKVKAPKRIYVPFGSTLLLTIVLTVILTSRLLSFIIMIIVVYVAYRAIFKKGL